MSQDIEMKDASPPTTPVKAPVHELKKLTLASPEILKSKVDVRPEPVMDEGLAGVPPKHFAKLAHWYVLPELKKASPFLYSRKQIQLRQLQVLGQQLGRKRKLLGNRPRHSTLVDCRFAGVGNLHLKKQDREALQKQIDEIWKS